jgi:predicted flap endonuclease-1-like 5' DNA nuclease
MMEAIEANWIVLSAALLVALLVGWWIFRRGSKGAQRSYRPDVLDEGAAPAQRNQALIDAPPAADLVPPPASVTMAGVGEIVSVAAQEGVAAVAAVSPSQAASDDLTRIKGLGPKIVALLGPLGVSAFSQIAAWDDAEIDRIDAQLGAFAGRIRRDNWVEQARLLAGGDTAAYEAKFGKL